MLIIGIAGGSGSGKTTVVKALTEQLKDDVVVIPQDSYYKDLSHATEEEKRVHNFDHPDSIDFELLRQQLTLLRLLLQTRTRKVHRRLLRHSLQT